MNPHRQPSSDPTKPRGRSGIRSEQLDHAQLHKDAQNAQRRATWRNGLIGSAMITAIFITLEFSQTKKPAPAPPTAPATIQTALLEKPKQNTPPPAAPPRVLEKIQPAETPDFKPLETALIPQPDPSPIEIPIPKKSTAEALLILVGPESQREINTHRDQELMAKTVENKTWDEYQSLLQESIRSSLTKIRTSSGSNRFDAIWKEPRLYQALLRWWTINKLTPATIRDSINDSYTGEYMIWLMKNDAAMEEFLLTISKDDQPQKVIEFLTSAALANESKREKYFSLALACAVVFDQPVSVAHPLKDSETTIDPLQRYNWFIAQNEKGRLAAPIDRSSARDLIWVVCAPVATSEMDWAVKKMNLNRASWGKSYGMIKYLMERAVKGLDPYEEYSFSEILKEGGICGDQSYFCVNTARSQGIPAITITGETSLGGHAWAAVKISPDTWSTEVGRVGGASKGQARNPQTGRSITEQEMQLWNDRAHQNEKNTLSVFHHLWLAEFFNANSDNEQKKFAVQIAQQFGPTFPEAWQALYTALEDSTKLIGEPKKPENLNEWQDFVRDMRHEFKDNPRLTELASTAETKYIFPYVSESESRRALGRQRNRIEQNSSEQVDLIATSLKNEADLILKSGKPEAKREISQLYDKSLKDYGGNITGFKMMAQDYFNYMKDDKDLASKAARDIELAFKRVVESGSGDWFRTQTEDSIIKMISGFYRAAGDPKRAELLEKRSKRELDKAERKAL